MTPFLWSRPLASTKNTPANGLVVVAAPTTQAAVNVPISPWVCTVRSLYIYNATAAAAFFFLANLGTIPTSFAAIVGNAMLVPATTAVLLDTTFFGTGGWNTPFTAGCSVAVSTSNTTFTAAGASFDITVCGE
jgi:hypothetical protein